MCGEVKSYFLLQHCMYRWLQCPLVTLNVTSAHFKSLKHTARYVLQKSSCLFVILTLVLEIFQEDEIDGYVDV